MMIYIKQKRIFVKTYEVVSLILLIGYLAMGTLLYVKQRNFLYFPTPDIKTPYTSMMLKNDGESIHIIILNPDNKDAILYFGGNAESMAGSTEYIAGQFPDHTVYLMDYRGYGGSSGEPSEEGLWSDALKLYDTVAGKHQHISVGGRSLGSAIATHLAARRDVYRLALITPFDSIVNVAKDSYPMYPVSLLLEDEYRSIENVKSIRSETFIIYAENDSVIPFIYTKNLIEAFDLKQLKVEMISGRGHNDISSDERYYRLMQEFIGAKHSKE